MVSINISTSIPGTSKSEESASDSDKSGLDNIFGSMLSVVEDKNKPISNSDTSVESDNEMLLLEEIKKKLGLNSKGSAESKEDGNSSGMLSTNILQIYQTYKTLIDEAIEVKNNATISFDMEKMFEPKLSQGPISLVGESQIEDSAEPSLTNLEKLTPISNDLLLDESLEEFSELEMQRIKASMKHDWQLTLEIGKNNKKTKSETKENTLPLTKNLFESNESKLISGQNKGASLLEQSKPDITQLNPSADNSKVESLLDQGQNSIKSVANKLNSPDLHLQNNKNSDEIQLKLLEKNWGKDLAKIIEKAIISGKEKIDISLDPQKLGKMHLTLSVVNNQTSIFISTENAASSLILSSAEERLAQMLESSGYKLSNFQANSNGNNNSNRNGSETKKNKDEKDLISNQDSIGLNEKEDNSSYSTDGRRIINIIA